MNVYQNYSGSYIPYFLKHGQPVQCTNQIVRIDNGIEIKEKCQTYLTCYGDGRSSDRASNGGLHCIGCHRLYNKEKQRKNRELMKQVSLIQQSFNPGMQMPQQSFNPGMQMPQQSFNPINFTGMMAPGYNEQFNSSSLVDPLQDISSSDEDNEIIKLKENLSHYKNEIVSLNKEIEELKGNFECMVIKFEDDNKKLKEQNEILKADILSLKKYLETIISNTNITHHKIEDRIADLEITHK